MNQWLAGNGRPFFLGRTEKFRNISAELAQMPTAIGDLVDLRTRPGGDDPMSGRTQVLRFDRATVPMLTTICIIVLMGPRPQASTATHYSRKSTPGFTRAVVASRYLTHRVAAIWRIGWQCRVMPRPPCVAGICT
jgi:hypothetical protein